MKKYFLVITLCLIILKAYTQTNGAASEEKLPLYNLFYLSKYISADNLNFEQREQVYYALLELIGKEKIGGLQDTSAVAFKFRDQYKKLRQANTESWLKTIIVNKKSFIEDLRKNGVNITPQIKTLVDDINDYPRKFYEKDSTINANLKLIEDLKSDIVEISTALKSNLHDKDTTISINTTLIGINIREVKSNDSSTTTWDIDLKGLKNKLSISENPTLEELHKGYNDYVENKIPKILSEIKKLRQGKQELSINNEKNLSQLARILIEQSPDKRTFINAFIENVKSSTIAPTAQISVITAAQNAQQSLSYSGLNIPSQSQMIEAMAIFLAKRAKQETAIWFMDQLRERIKNPLVHDGFPETIKLLETLEDYHSANFGKSWRYAIATDFVNMPRNLVNSNWVGEVLSKDSTTIRTAVHFGYNIQRLILERYNYRDIIRNLYLDPYYKKNNNDLNIALNKSFSLLYIITNELFTLQKTGDENKFRLLSYEEINSIDSNQWKALQELLKLKYQKDLENAKFPDIHKPEIKKWLGTLLITLSQFDRINQEQQQLRAANNLESNDQSFQSVWKVLHQVIGSIDTTPYFQSTQPNRMAQYISSLQNTLEIIADIQQKNFLPALQKSLKLIDSYYTIPEKNIGTTNYLTGLGNTRFSIQNGKILLRPDSIKDNILSGDIYTRFLESLTIDTASNNAITLKYVSKDKQGVVNNLQIDKDELLIIQQMGSLINQMSDKEAASFVKENAKTYIYNKQLSKYISSLKEKPSIELEVFKALALYANMNVKTSLEAQQQTAKLFSNQSFSLNSIKQYEYKNKALPTIRLENNILTLGEKDNKLFAAKIKTTYFKGLSLTHKNGTLSMIINNDATSKAIVIGNKDTLDMLSKIWTSSLQLKPDQRVKYIDKEIKNKYQHLYKSLENTDKQLEHVLGVVALYHELSSVTQPNQWLEVAAKFRDVQLEIQNNKFTENLEFKLEKKYMDERAAQLVKLTSFFSDVVSTNDPQQLANVIESHALPPTSYKIKHRFHSSWDLNAYVGAFGAYMSTTSNSSLKCQWTGGITAPIGITYTNKRIENWFKGGISGPSFHLQLIDLGNIVNHYLVTPDSAYNKEVHFTEVFSPGINLMFHVRNTPLVIFGGASGIPLRSYKEGDQMMNNKLFDAYMFKAGVKIDIPLVNLSSKKK